MLVKNLYLSERLKILSVHKYYFFLPSHCPLKHPDYRTIPFIYGQTQIYQSTKPTLSPTSKDFSFHAKQKMFSPKMKCHRVRNFLVILTERTSVANLKDDEATKQYPEAKFQKQRYSISRNFLGKLNLLGRLFERSTLSL